MTQSVHRRSVLLACELSLFLMLITLISCGPETLNSPDQLQCAADYERNLITLGKTLLDEGQLKTEHREMVESALASGELLRIYQVIAGHYDQ